MIPDPKTGLLVTGPSVSPENNFLTEDGKRGTLNMGATMDREIIFELFNNCIKAAAAQTHFSFIRLASIQSNFKI